MSHEHIRKERAQLGLMQHEFARAMGVSFTTVNRWERGRATRQPDRLGRLVDLVGNVKNGGLSGNLRNMGAVRSRFPRKFSNKVTLHGPDMVCLATHRSDLVDALSGADPEIEVRISVRYTAAQKCSRIRTILKKVKKGWVI